MDTSTLTRPRIASIDVLRGIVMVIMALDHVRDYFHIGANLDDPLNLATTSVPLFFTRWITHFCAPVFVFLSGTSIYLQSQRKSKAELSAFLFKRGLWLIFVEFVIISFAWTFNPFYNVIPMQVIWAIGISMVILALMVRFSWRVVLLVGLLIVCGHNLLDIPEEAPGFKTNFLWDMLHHGRFTAYAYAPNHYVLVVYPFLAWTGLMMLGYCCGILFTQLFAASRRFTLLCAMGTGMILLFVVVRWVNRYGDPVPWSTQPTALFSFLSFIKTNKYPPSLLYMCMTIGPALILLAFLEKVRNRFTAMMAIFGRTAFFYYILHLYLIHILSMIMFFVNGHTMQDAIQLARNVPFLFVVPGEGFGLPMTYLVWLAVVVSLYPLCKLYDRYKTHHKEKKWLSYL